MFRLYFSPARNFCANSRVLLRDDITKITAVILRAAGLYRIPYIVFMIVTLCKSRDDGALVDDFVFGHLLQLLLLVELVAERGQRPSKRHSKLFCLPQLRSKFEWQSALAHFSQLLLEYEFSRLLALLRRVHP